MRAKIVSLVALAALVLSLGLTAAASDASPMWDSGKACTPTLTFSGSTANCNLVITAGSSTDKITATMTLYRINASGSRTKVANWSSLTGTGRLSLSKPYSGAVSGTTYLLMVNGTVAGSAVSGSAQARCP